MAGLQFTSNSTPQGFIALSQGLNSTASPLNVLDTQATALQNIDFDRFGSFLKRNGYKHLNAGPTALNSGATSTSLHFFENKTLDVLLGTFGNKLFTTPTLAFPATWTERVGSQAVVFTGSGLDDMTTSGTYTGAGDIEYKVVIDATGTPDTYEWFKDSVSQAAGVNIIGGAVLLDNGLSITFAATTGHTVSDQWVFHPATVVTAGDDNLWMWKTFNNTAYGVNGVDSPIKLTAPLVASLMTVPTDMTTAKHIESFENYMFLGNSTIGGTLRPTRLNWSTLDDADTWDAADFKEVGLDDGEEITGLKKLGNRLAIFKERSIYIAVFTGDADIPFTFQKTASDVGAISGHSIQEVKNALVFMSYDGIYIFDGFNSIKISDVINTTFLALSENRYDVAVSGYQKSKNRYWLSLTSGGGAQHDTVITWDSANNAFSVYSGISANAITVLNTAGEERIYFGDYAGFAYQADVAGQASDRSTANASVAIDAFFKTKWFNFGDIVLQKGFLHSVFYYDYAATTLSVAYSYDLENGNQYSQTFDLEAPGAPWGAAAGALVWNEGAWGSEGGKFKRLDHTGRGRLIRSVFSNSVIDETFKINGIGYFVHLETDA